MTRLAFEDLECIHLLVFSINIHWFGALRCWNFSSAFRCRYFNQGVHKSLQVLPPPHPPESEKPE